MYTHVCTVHINAEVHMLSLHCGSETEPNHKYKVMLQYDCAHSHQLCTEWPLPITAIQNDLQMTYYEKLCRV